MATTSAFNANGKRMIVLADRAHAANTHAIVANTDGTANIVVGATADTHMPDA